MRPTLSDIARVSGVSAATVDRVINNREGVKSQTRARVLTVARQLGYLDPNETPSQQRLRPLRLHILLPEGSNAFICELAEQVSRQTQKLDAVEAIVETILEFDPPALAARLAELEGATDGIGLVALDHPTVREAIRKLAQSGTPIITIASDIHNVPRLAYIGIDNGQAGRLAGYVTGRFLGKGQKAKVAFFAGSLSYRGHQEREMGFRQVLSEDFKTLEIVELHEVREDRDKAYAETLALLDRHPDLAAIYNAGGATTGIASALKERGRDRDIVFVAHEVTPGNKALLLDGTLDAVIDQDPRAEISEALNTLAHAARGIDYRGALTRLQIVFRENLPME